MTKGTEKLYNYSHSEITLLLVFYRSCPQTLATWSQNLCSQLTHYNASLALQLEVKECQQQVVIDFFLREGVVFQVENRCQAVLEGRLRRL